MMTDVPCGQVIDMLCCELEVAHRYLEGKYQALKILQGKVKEDKHTLHIDVMHWPLALTIMITNICFIISLEINLNPIITSI